MISIVCPVYNEEKYIGKLLDFYEKIEPQEKELFVIDGLSTDRTRDIVLRYASQNPNIYLLDNEHRFVPFALNLAIQRCKSDIIVRWDAHTQYSADYLLQILDVFEITNADIVGGPMRAVGESAFQRAVAYATSTPFGVGNSQFHYEDYKGYTDSVYLGAWKKAVFEKIGLFDEQMLRNQDDEFHYRAKSVGFKIFQDPAIKSYYFPRDNIKSLCIQYFGYGLFKPLVLKKIRSEWKVRHFVPMFFVCYLTLLPVLVWFHTISFIPLFFYFLLATIFSAKAKGGLKGKLCALLVYPSIHIAYGVGFCRGLLKI
ncbi:MAG TPA: glycosyltransferase family 2 protein [Cyclobacteriaceae bacterium]|nr:glycosyltransferase family 2 protein [Cyclobacteriaceae bacterium]HRJ83281.1 glycosyltransferase family 2 protein [Cyclobacteriaceae bacterium]